MSILKKNRWIILSIVLFGLSLYIRYQMYTLSNRDVLILEDWYRHLYKHGKAGLADESFSNYTPLYLYSLWITRLFSNWLSRIAAIKLIPTVFDFVSALAIFLMARIKYNDHKPYLFSAMFLLLPTVLFNSTGWGQIDSMYTSFLLLCTYFLMIKKPFYALLMFGFAFSLKSQSIFFLPFLGILFLKGRIRWFHFLLIPAVYMILAIPAVLIGRSWLSILTIYIDQVGQFQRLSMSAPNLYIFISDSLYEVGVWVGLVIFLIGIAAWGWVNWRAKIAYNPRQIILMALTTLTLVPFLLPKMHERYFYPADVFSFATVIFFPEMWFVPLLFQITSGLSYSMFILNAPTSVVMIGAVINTGVLIYILRKQFLSFADQG